VGPVETKKLAASGDTGFQVIVGFSAAETAAGAATVKLTDGNGGVFIAGCTLAANGIQPPVLIAGGRGVKAKGTVWLALTGSADVAVYGF
jgi:hypothetical protein